jgi:hypothetical protein
LAEQVDGHEVGLGLFVGEDEDLGGRGQQVDATVPNSWRLASAT